MKRAFSMLSSHAPLAFVAAAGFCGSSAQAVVVWSDNFSGINSGAVPSRDFTANSVEDWSLTDGTDALSRVNTSSGRPAPSLALVDTSATGAAIARVFSTQWSLSSNPLTTTNHILRVSFDMRVVGFTQSTVTGADTNTPRFILRSGSGANQNFGIGFGAGANGALTFFGTNSAGAGGAPTAAGAFAIGLGQPGFEFGTLTGDANSNTTDTFDAEFNRIAGFIRFTYEYDFNTGTVIGVATNLNTGQQVTFNSTMNAGLTFTDAANSQLVIASSNSSTSNVHYDNITIETLIPEPSTILMAFAGAGLFLVRRRAA